MRTALQFFRNSFVLLMALQVLNMSINAIEFERLPGNDIVAVNEFNSVLEYISEGILGYYDAFPEYTSGSNKSTEFHKTFTIKLYKPARFQLELPPLVTPLIHQAPLDDNRRFDYSAEINPPPPKQVA